MADVSRLPPAIVAHWDWQQLAACRDVEIATSFHPDGERDPARAARVTVAKQICAACPVVAECRSWARAIEEPYGVWGGELGPEETRGPLEDLIRPPQLPDLLL